MSKEHIDELSDLLQKTAKQPRKQYKAYIFIAVVVIVIMTSPFVAEFVINKVLNKKIQDVAAILPSECTFSYDMTSYELWKRKYYIDGVKVSCNDINVISADRIELSSVVNDRPIPSNMIIKVTGGKSNVRSMPYGAVGEMLSTFGYDELNFESYISYNWGVASKDLRIFNFMVNIEDAGELVAELYVPTVDANTIKGLVKQATINEPIKLWIGFKEGGFSSKVVDYYAKKYAVSYAEAKRMILGNMEDLIAKEDKYITEQKNKLIQIYRYIDYPHEIIVTTKANSDLSLDKIFNMIRFENVYDALVKLSEAPIDVTTR